MAEVRGKQIASLPLETQHIIRRMNAASDWTGPDDPDNPRNFPAIVRILSIAIITSLAFVSSFAGAIYAPAQDAVLEEFHQSREVAVLPLSLYNLGLAFGPLVGAPLSETYGRKAVFVATTPIFVLFMLGSGFSKNITSLVVCRFFAGMFASPNINNASATILDFTAPRYRGASLGIYYSLPSLGATIAPLIGGFVVRAKGWRWTQWVAIIVIVTLYIPVLFTKETYKKVIIRRRATRMGISDSSSQQTSVSRTFRHFFTVLILRPLHMLFTEPIVTLVSLYNGFIFGLLYTFVISVPWIFRHYYGFGKTGESLTYLGVTLGTLIACVPFVIIDFLFYQKRLSRWQQAHDESEPLAPENRLVSAMVGSFLLPASLLIAGWTPEYHIHWFVPVFFQGMAMMASLLIYAGANLFMLDAYGPLYGASASGAMMLSRYTLSFAFPMFALQMFQSMGAGWATTILAVFALLMAPIPWCFWVFSERLRKRSRYETST
ncbi:major facilitator superfamily domain-containing protein [Dactylonectria estremocensis]|uniref:Major facilitator superfamily domain-containing protein n=1 Tax=Dactylonectria estremocensis TaxID=1079267 RepID=A0A9P9FAN8_9HYPO|nr:major facilitator superfamily domain-containing protein [Dactylonectria estremocensis]